MTKDDFLRWLLELKENVAKQLVVAEETAGESAEYDFYDGANQILVEVINKAQDIETAVFKEN